MKQIDRQILIQLQHHAAQLIADIGRKIALLVTHCWRLIQRVKETGIIRKRITLFYSKAIGVGMSVFVAVRSDQSNVDWLKYLKWSNCIG